MTELTTQLTIDDSLKVMSATDEALRDWFANQAKTYQLPWLLAHADDGVIWGYLDDQGNLQLSGEAFADVSPPLRLTTLQQARLFGSVGEVLVWRTASGLVARYAHEGAGPTHHYYDTQPLLWGDQVEEGPEDIDFVLLRQGEQGLLHAPPLRAAGIERLPAHLTARHYLDYEPDTGQAFVCLSRLMSLS